MGVKERYEEKQKAAKSSTTGVAARYERKKKGEEIDKYFEDVQSYFKWTAEDYNNYSYDNAAAGRSKIDYYTNDLRTRGNEIRTWLDANKDTLDAKSYADIIASLDSIGSGLDSIYGEYDKKLNYISGFNSAEEYNKLPYNPQAQKAAQEYLQNSLSDGSLYKNQQGAEGWNKYLADNKANMEAAIAAQKKKSFWEKARDVILEAAQMSAQSGDSNIPMQGMMNAQINAYRNDVSYMRPQDDWSKVQQYEFGRLYLESPEKAYAYAEETNKKNAQAKEEAARKEIQDNATSGGWAEVGNTIGAIATAPLGMADFLDDIAKISAGREITPDGNISPFEYSQAVTEGISTHLNEKGGVLNENIPVIGGKGWGDVYGLGTSIAQSMASAYTLGPYGTLVSYFGQGAAAGVDDALRRGASEDQALLYGTLLGTFEGVAEMIGIENLFKLSSASTIKGVIKNILKQAGAEGTEEGLTTVLNNIADAWVMQDKSNFNKALEDYMAQGMSKSEAQWKVFWDSIEGILYDTAGGAVSGGVSGGIHTGFNAIGNNTAIKEHGQSILNKGGQDALMQLAREKVDADKKLTRLTDKAEAKPTASRIGMLSAYMEQSNAKANRDTFQRAFEQQGLSKKDAERATAYVMDELSPEESAKLENNKTVMDAVDAVIENPNLNIGADTIKLALARENVKTDLQNETNGDIIDTESEEISNEGNEGTESVRLRDSSERLGGTNTERQISRVESGTGSLAQRRQTVEGKPRDRQASRLVDEGREVSVASLGVSKGSKIHTVRLLDIAPENEIDSMKAARKEAEARGLIIKFFAGGNLVIEENTEANVGKADKDKTYFEANGYINGKVMLVRVDHYKFTADQIARHEIGHDMIAKGEVDINAVREKLSEIVGGKENVDKIAEVYATAYANTGLNENEIWEECICDSLGDMNIFGYDKEAAELMKEAIPDIQKAVKETKAENTPQKQKNTADGGGNFSIEIEPDSGTKFVVVEQKSIKKLMGYQGNSIAAKVRNFMKQYRGTVLPLGSTDKSYMRREAEGEYTNPAKAVDEVAYNAKLKAASELTNLLSAAVFDRHENDNGRHPDATRGWNYYNLVYVVPIDDANIRVYSGEIQIKLINRGDCFYDITKIKDITDGSAGQAFIKAAGSVYNVSKNSIPQKSDLSTPSEKISSGKASREIDDEYLSAVERGDMETAQKMVDEAAKKAGYTVKAYHGTDNEFTAFDKNKIMSNTGAAFYGTGFYFSTSERDANNYGNKIMPVYLRVGKTLDLDSSTWTYDLGIEQKKSKVEVEKTHIEQAPKGFINLHYTTKDAPNIWKSISNVSPAQLTDDETGKKFVEKKLNPESSILPRDIKNLSELARNNGYNSIKGGGTNIGDIGVEYVLFDEENIKSADPVTYDDKGNVIPLSERFNTKESDIRFSRELDLITYMDEEAIREGREMDEGKAPTDRERLANALESITENEIEKNKLAEYKAKIEKMNAETEKLAQLKSEIKELTFGKGEKNPEKLKNLRSEATKTENRINIYDKQLLNLEVTTALKRVLEREKQKAYKRAAEKGREALRKNVEGRNKTVERNKIKRVAHELDALLNRGTKERNVKKGVSSVVRSALDISNMLFATDDELLLAGIGTEYTDAESAAMDEYMALYEEYHSYDDAVTENKEKRKELRSEMNEVKKGFEDVLERERKRIGALKAKGAFDNLVNEYAAMQSSKDEYISQAFKPEVLEYLRALATDINPETLVSEMSLEQIKKLYKAFAMVKKMVQDSNKIFRNGKAEDFSKLKADIFSELSTMKERFGKDSLELVGKVLNGINEFGWNNLRPVDAFDLVGSETFSGLYWDVIKAQGTYAHDVKEVGDALRGARVRHGYKKWTISDIKQFNTADGRAFELTLGERMSIYAYSKREQADEHLRVGGVQHAKGAIYKKKGINYLRKKQAAPYMIDDKLRLDIINSLSKEQRAYVDEMQAKLTEWGEKGNEASRVLYGIDLFTEKVYFPLFSSSDYLSSQSTEIGNTATTASLLSSGMTKPTTPGANNPIILRAFDDVILEHFDKMSKYHAYAVTIDNLRKTFDAQGKDSSDNMISLRTLIGSKYGVGATEYFKDYITDLNGSNNVGGVNNPLEGFFAKSKGVAVAANISVWVQQYFSIVRAMGEVNPKYFVPFLGESFKEGDMRLYEEMKKYAPVAIIKEMGGFDVGANHTIKDYIGYDEAKLTGDKAWHNFQEGLGVGANVMDKLGWLTIWKSVKKEVAAKGKYKVGSQVYFEACGKRMEEVITRTQVYDSVNSKSAYMRSKNPATKYLVSFMGEPTTIVGMLEVATIKLSRAISTKNKAEIGKAIGKFTGVALSVAISTALTSIFKSFVYALRDNDEDEKYWEKYAHTLGEEFASDLNPLNYLPIARDIVSIWEGWDIDRPDMTLIADLVTCVKKLVYLNDDASVREKLDAWYDIALAVANLSGVPAKNIIRDIKGIYKTFENANNKYKYHGGKSFVQGFIGEEESRSEKLYNAIVGEDAKRVEHYRSTYDTDAKYQGAVRKALKENDPRIAVAAQALIDGDYKEYSDQIEDIVAEGHFSEKDVKAAIESMRNAMDETEEEKEETAEKEESIFETEYYYNALVSGDTEYAEVMREDIINAHIANGKDEEEAQNAFESSFRSYVGKMYRDGGASREDAEDLLINYGGRDENEAYWDLRKWDYVKENGSDEGYSMYNEFNEAVRTGKNLKAVIKEYTSHGKDKEDLARQITSYYKPLYKEMTNRERANIKGYLLNAYVLLGYDRSKKMKDIDKWLED